MLQIHYRLSLSSTEIKSEWRYNSTHQYVLWHGAAYFNTGKTLRLTSTHFFTETDRSSQTYLRLKDHAIIQLH
jgi:hypothetical protein